MRFLLPFFLFKNRHKKWSIMLGNLFKISSVIFVKLVYNKKGHISIIREWDILCSIVQ